MYTWGEIGDIANKYGIDWGWDLWKTDKPHFQDNRKSLESKETINETLQRENDILRRRADDAIKLLAQVAQTLKPNGK